jgi:hypothetical protein
VSGPIAARVTALPRMPDDAVEAVRRVEGAMLELEQLPIETAHLIHGGIYARTVRLPAEILITGVLVKRPTVVVLSGDVTVFTGADSVRLVGYHVLPASAGRKQIFRSHAETFLTMLFPSSARSVDDAEFEFTDEAELLQRRADGDSVTITGE